MNQFIAPRPLPQCWNTPSKSPAGPLSPAVNRAQARALADALDRAMTLGQIEHAARIVASARRLMGHHPILCEQVARHHVMQRDPSQALAVIDSCPVHTASLRLWRIMCMLQLGRGHEAHIDLRQWASKPSAPIAARTLLALLEWRSGAADDAITPLLQNLKQIEDPQSLAILMMINAARSRIASAERWAGRLCLAQDRGSHATGRWPDAGLMIRSIGIAPRSPENVGTTGAAVSADQVAGLALELLANEAVLPSLVEAQKLQPHWPRLQLLSQAVERILADLQDRAAGYLAIAELVMLQEDSGRALDWLRRGMAECPMSIELARTWNEWQVKHAPGPNSALEEAA